MSWLCIWRWLACWSQIWMFYILDFTFVRLGLFIELLLNIQTYYSWNWPHEARGAYFIKVFTNERKCLLLAYARDIVKRIGLAALFTFEKLFSLFQNCELKKNVCKLGPGLSCNLEEKWKTVFSRLKLQNCTFRLWLKETFPTLPVNSRPGSNVVSEMNNQAYYTKR